MATATDDRLLTRKQAAEVLGFQPQTLARWKWEGRADRPPEVRVGRAVRYRASELSRWIAERGERPDGATRTRNPRT
jgi:predicted DNA-binding transcriptional regulator AlpA